jgi:hypothetical protein
MLEEVVILTILWAGDDVLMIAHYVDIRIPIGIDCVALWAFHVKRIGFDTAVLYCSLQYDVRVV